jgi:prophage DNA circulation protein
VDATLTASGNYLDARQALMDVLDQPGPMTLIHPWLGQVQVSQRRPYRLSEDNRNGGRATFTLALVADAGLTLAPSAAVSTQDKVQATATAVQTAANDHFASGWNVDGLASWGLAALESDLTDTLTKVESVVSGVTDGIAAQIRAPYDMGAAIIGAVNRITDAVAVPINAFNLYKNLFKAGADPSSTAILTPLTRQQFTASFALHHLVRQTALAQAAVTASEMTYASSDDALVTLSLLLDALDAEMLATNPVTDLPIDDTAYVALDALRAAVTDDLRARGAQLPDVTTYVPNATLPALVIAWRLYGDSSRVEEIVARNHLRWPGFVPGGQPLEVLNV